MLEVSRRNFLKATALSAVCLSGLNASFLEFSQAKQVKYFIKDSEIPHQGNFINWDNFFCDPHYGGGLWYACCV